MKRNHTTKRAGRSGQSPYKRYNKRPYQYSPAYYAWHENAKRGAERPLYAKPDLLSLSYPI